MRARLHPLALALVMLALLTSLAVLLRPPSARGAGAPLLVVAPHPDDEALAFDGVIASAAAAGRPVYVAVVTNGASQAAGDVASACGLPDGLESAYARSAFERDGETIRAMTTVSKNAVHWTMTKATSHVFFLGYLDGSLSALLAGNGVVDPSGIGHTYAPESLSDASSCNGDYHYLVSGEHQPLDIAAVRSDLADLVAQLKPADVYTTSAFDGHPDHSVVGRLVTETLASTATGATLHVTLLHPTGDGICEGESAAWWPNPTPGADLQPVDPIARSTPGVAFAPFSIFGTGSGNDTGYRTCPDGNAPVARDWGPLGAPNQSVAMPASMRTALATNLHWQTISLYGTQLGCPDSVSCGYMHAFVKSNEFFWSHRVASNTPPMPTAGIGLTSTNGTLLGAELGVRWFDDPAQSFAPGATQLGYTWLRCNATSNWVCTPISGAVGPSYVIQRADANYVLRARVRGHNAAGWGSWVYSGSTEKILAAPKNTALPTITGTAQVGFLLTAHTSTWTGSPSFAYQWLRCSSTGLSCSSIDGATDSTYTLTGDDAGATIRVVVTGSNVAGELAATSNRTAVVKWPPAPTNTAKPTISGTLQGGKTLTAGNGSWTGGTSLTFTYTWERCATSSDCSEVGEGKTYTLTGDDAGNRMRVTVTATNATGTGSATSALSAVVAMPPKPVNSTKPTLTGTAQVGKTLAAGSGSWSGGTPIAYTFTWNRCSTGGDCSEVGEGATYTIAADDVGNRISVTVTATNVTGSGTATSVPTAVVTWPAAPTNSTKPTVTGTARAGYTLTAKPGTWAGGTPITYTYAWDRCDSSGTLCETVGDGPTYTLTDADVGARLRVTVTATNVTDSGTATSGLTGVVSARN